jgi:hypothetical protein
MYLFSKRLQLIIISMLLVVCTHQNQPELLPEHLLGYQLTRKLKGPEARAFVDKIHLREVTPENNTIGFYQKEDMPLTIYITEYNSAGEAKKDFERMTRKISPGNSVFINGEYMEIEGRRLYRCFGMGQTHFVFHLDNRLFWISVNTIQAGNFIRDYLKIIS